MPDIVMTLYIESKGKIDLTKKGTQRELSYIMNDSCTKLENFGCNVFYKMKLNDKEIKLSDE